MNINNQVEVKLTDYGLQICKDYWKSLNLEKYGFKFSDLKIEDNILKIELWGLMIMFGKYLYMGNTEIPFENNEIKIL